MIDFFLFLKANWQDIALACTGLVTAASVVVKLTPSPEDDKMLAKVVNILNMLALNPKPK